MNVGAKGGSWLKEKKHIKSQPQGVVEERGVDAPAAKKKLDAEKRCR